jgi:hypothetical protein
LIPPLDHTFDAGGRRSTGTDPLSPRLRLVVASLIAAGVLLRALLAWRAPTDFGYVYDYYHEALVAWYRTGHLPAAADCWECYQPPLFSLLGLPLYTLGLKVFDGDGRHALRLVQLIPLAASACTVLYTCRLVRLTARGAEFVVATALTLSVPCLFISSYGLEADILLTALLTVFLYDLTRLLDPGSAVRAWPAVRLGLVAGLACETKYSGLLAPLTLGLTGAFRLATGPDRRRVARALALALLVCTLAGFWPYLHNYRTEGRWLVANGSAEQGFALGTDRLRDRPRYDFTSFRLRGLISLASGQIKQGKLTQLPIYRSVWTTLYGQTWSDMSFFSDPSRHGDPGRPYPRKVLNPLVVGAVLLFALLPTALAAVGFVLSLADRRWWPLALASVLSLAVYFRWMTVQDDWSIKTKYILFLVGPFMLYVVIAIEAVGRRSDAARQVLLTGLALLAAAAHLYCLDFAWS